MRTSKIIQMAANHPDYINRNFYLCSVISSLLVERKITESEAYSATWAIKVSLNFKGFLRNHLADLGKLANNCPYSSSIYREAAAEHWAALVKYLQVQEMAENVYKRGTPLHAIACSSWARGFDKAQAYREASNAGYAYCVAVKEISIIWDRMDKGLAELEAKCTARPEDFIGTWK